MRIYFQLLQWVNLTDPNGPDHDYKPLATSTTADGVYAAVVRHEEKGGTPDDLYVETFEMRAGLPSALDTCLGHLAYEEWLDEQERAAA